MVIVLLALELVVLLVKKLAPPASGAAVTSILTPCEGMVEVTLIVTGKVVPTAAGTTVLFAGLVVMVRLASCGGGGVVPPPSPPLLQENKARLVSNRKEICLIVFISII